MLPCYQAILPRTWSCRMGAAGPGLLAPMSARRPEASPTSSRSACRFVYAAALAAAPDRSLTLWCGGAQAMPKKGIDLRGWRPAVNDFCLSQKRVFVCASVLDHADTGILKLWNQTPAENDGIDWGKVGKLMELLRGEFSGDESASNSSMSTCSSRPVFVGWRNRTNATTSWVVNAKSSSIKSYLNTTPTDIHSQEKTL